MKVLIVCSGNAPAGQLFDLKMHQAFIYEQVRDLEKLNANFEYLLIKGKGLLGYLKHLRQIREKVRNHYDLIHAHNGFCGLIANLQRKIPVVTTYHGSDINIKLLRWISYVSILLSTQNIYVSENQFRKSFIKRRSNIIACGIDIEEFQPADKYKCRESLRLNQGKQYILFSSSLSLNIKNSALAIYALKLLNDASIELLELRGRTRKEVSLLLNSCNLLLLTSFSEGSPQIIKEAMACNCPIVSTDVGDVHEIIGETKGCYITSYNPVEVTDKVHLALEFSKTKGLTNGRERIFKLNLDNGNVAKLILEIYKKVQNKVK
jgi:glycosyltransferase involved in cell wall biosynthesis